VPLTDTAAKTIWQRAWRWEPQSSIALDWRGVPAASSSIMLLLLLLVAASTSFLQMTPQYMTAR